MRIQNYLSKLYMLQMGTMLSLSALGVSAHSQDAEDKPKPFMESAVQLPVAPTQTDLLAFYNSGNQNFYVDSKSLSIAADGSLRYTMIGISNAGAKNISYEGIRCDSYEKKLFAFGRADGSWSMSRNNDWSAISNKGANKQHSTLAWDFVCDGTTVAGPVEKILLHIKRNESLKRSP